MNKFLKKLIILSVIILVMPLINGYAYDGNEQYNGVGKIECIVKSNDGEIIELPIKEHTVKVIANRSFSDEITECHELDLILPLST